MSRRLSRISLALVILLSSEVWALGLGDIRMNSALNEPLNAEIELLSATPDELDNLTVAMAAAETFDRYGIDRPFFLQDIQFNIVRSGRVDGNYVQVRSGAPMSEPFLTFLVEASWSRGRLLREYTVFLDPPTFAPPAADTAPAVQAPTRSEPTDSGRIERAAPPPQQARPVPAPAPHRSEQQQPHGAATAITRANSGRRTIRYHFRWRSGCRSWRHTLGGRITSSSGRPSDHESDDARHIRGESGGVRRQYQYSQGWRRTQDSQRRRSIPH